MTTPYRAPLAPRIVCGRGHPYRSDADPGARSYCTQGDCAASSMVFEGDAGAARRIRTVFPEHHADDCYTPPAPDPSEGATP